MQQAFEKHAVVKLVLLDPGSTEAIVEMDTPAVSRLDYAAAGSADAVLTPHRTPARFLWRKTQSRSTARLLRFFLPERRHAQRKVASLMERAETRTYRCCHDKHNEDEASLCWACEGEARPRVAAMGEVVQRRRAQLRRLRLLLRQDRRVRTTFVLCCSLRSRWLHRSSKF